MDDWFVEAVLRMEPMPDKIYPYQRAAIDALTKEPHPSKTTFVIGADFGEPYVPGDKIAIITESPPCEVFAGSRRFGKTALTIATAASIAAMGKALADSMKAEFERMHLDLILGDTDMVTAFDLKGAPDAYAYIKAADEAATPNPARRLAPVELREIHLKNRAPRKGRRHGKR